MKIARLIATIVVLLNRGTVTARELAERFEVSTRTIYRDIEALAAAGIPVYATQGNSGGISLMEGYLLNRTLITDSEQESLLFALQTLQAVNYPEVDLILDKLGSVFNSPPTDWVEVEFSPWGKGPEEELKFNTIRRAILGQIVLEFQYVSADGSRSSRVVEPMKLYFKGAAWYLWAWCQSRNGFRTFRISRIRNLVESTEAFVRRQFTQPAVSDKSDGKCPVQLKLRFQPQAAYRVFDDFDDASVTKNSDGTMDLTVQFLEDEWVYGYLLSYGPDLEVIHPEHIREILRTRMQEALKKY